MKKGKKKKERKEKERQAAQEQYTATLSFINRATVIDYLEREWPFPRRGQQLRPVPQRVLLGAPAFLKPSVR